MENKAEGKGVSKVRLWINIVMQMQRDNWVTGDGIDMKATHKWQYTPVVYTSRMNNGAFP